MFEAASCISCDGSWVLAGAAAAAAGASRCRHYTGNATQHHRGAEGAEGGLYGDDCFHFELSFLGAAAPLPGAPPGLPESGDLPAWAGKELADQVLENQGRLSWGGDLTALLEEGIRTAGIDADVLTAQQALRQDAEDAAVRDLVVLGVDAHADHRLVGIPVDADALDLSQGHALPWSPERRPSDRPHCRMAP